MDDRPILLLGRGPRARRLGEVLLALARIRAEETGRDDLAAATPQDLEDLEELLSRGVQGPSHGTLLLEVDTVPLEDIGFVRRFLERRPAWSLLVLGELAADPRSRALLALPRADWIAWPPDLDQLEGLLDLWTGAPARSAAPGQAAAPRSAPRERTRRRRQEDGPEASRAGVDVGALVEERLAGSSLAGNGAPRFVFSGEGPVHLLLDRRALAQGLDGLLALARLCAGGTGEVRASTEAAPGGGARVRLEFPLGPLTDGDLPDLLDQPFEGEPLLSAAVAEARAGAEGLRGLGAGVELVPHQSGRLAFEVQLAGEPPSELPAAAAAAPGAGRRLASAQDPFA